MAWRKPVTISGKAPQIPAGSLLGLGLEILRIVRREWGQDHSGSVFTRFPALFSRLSDDRVAYFQFL